MKSQIIGYTSGTFDMFHHGHVALIQRASNLCDKLIVGVATDNLCENYKKKRTIQPQEDRKALLENLKGVSAVVYQDDLDKRIMWEKLKFDILFVGDDWFGDLRWKEYEIFLKERNAKIIYFTRTPGISSTKLRSRINGPKKPELLLVDLDGTMWPFQSNLTDNLCESLEVFREAFEILQECGIRFVFCSRSKKWNEGCQGLLKHHFDKSLDLDSEKHAVFYTVCGKIPHFTYIHETTGIPYKSMCLFDDEQRNCKEAEDLGIKSQQVDKEKGLTWKIFSKMLLEF